MTIIESRVVLVPIKVKAFCDQCRVELPDPCEMPSDTSRGDGFTGRSPMYMYVCPSCGEAVISESRYPRIEYWEAQK